MNNYDRAIHILEAARRPGDLRIHPNDAVEALAQAGLLADDLPKPDLMSRKGWPRWELKNFAGTDETVRVDYMASNVFVHVPQCNMSASPKDAAALAHVIHAAAHYPKGWTQA